MYWVKAKWLPGLFDAVNEIASGRSHDQDGTIGDAAHRKEKSGHNPDDTPGVEAERQDADNIPEVRAGDVDARLNEPSVTMENVVQAVLATPEALALLIYIIYNGRIWRAANGWREEPYNGKDKHDKHAHFSGHPDADEIVYQWACIRQLKNGDDDMGQSFGPIQLTLTKTSLAIPPVQAGLADPRKVWLNVGADTDQDKYALRIWATNGDGHWFPVEVDPKKPTNGLYVLTSGVVFSVELPKGLRILSLIRWGLDASGNLVDPHVEGAKVYDGSISACFERM